MKAPAPLLLAFAPRWIPTSIFDRFLDALGVASGVFVATLGLLGAPRGARVNKKKKEQIKNVQPPEYKKSINKPVAVQVNKHAKKINTSNLPSNEVQSKKSKKKQREVRQIPRPTHLPPCKSRGRCSRYLWGSIAAPLPWRNISQSNFFLISHVRVPVNARRHRSPAWWRCSRQEMKSAA